jgi:hypothetical protein
VLVDDGHGEDDLLHLVVEIKGYCSNQIRARLRNRIRPVDACRQLESSVHWDWQRRIRRDGSLFCDEAPRPWIAEGLGPLFGGVPAPTQARARTGW